MTGLGAPAAASPWQSSSRFSRTPWACRSCREPSWRPPPPWCPPGGPSSHTTLFRMSLITWSLSLLRMSQYCITIESSRKALASCHNIRDIHKDDNWRLLQCCDSCHQPLSSNFPLIFQVQDSTRLRVSVGVIDGFLDLKCSGRYVMSAVRNVHTTLPCQLRWCDVLQWRQLFSAEYTFLSWNSKYLKTICGA